MIDAPTLTALFDAPPMGVFHQGPRRRYRHANQTLLMRLGLKDEAAILGKRAAELSPRRWEIATLHRTQSGAIGNSNPRRTRMASVFFQFRAWLVPDTKVPLLEHGKVIGLAGISRDLPGGGASALGRLQTALTFAERHLDELLTIAGLAERAGMSIAQFERHTQRLFELTPRQWLLSRRIERARCR